MLGLVLRQPFWFFGGLGLASLGGVLVWFVGRRWWGFCLLFLCGGMGVALPVLGLQGQTDREAAESLIRSVFSRWEQEQKASLLLSAGKVERDQMETKQKRTRKNPKKLKIWKMEWITNKRMDVVLTYAGFRPFDRQVHRASKQTKLWKLQLTRASNRYGWSILSLELLRPREGLFYPFRRSKRVL